MGGSGQNVLPTPPLELLESASLFLDLDGTLLDLVERPEEVCADAELRSLLIELGSRLDGRLAVISGRSLDQIDAILGEAAADLALSGSHGCEHRSHGELVQPDRPSSLDDVAARMHVFAAERAGVIVEEKSFGVALHYRMAPDAKAEAHALGEALSNEFGLSLQHGKLMIELRVAGGDKGTALQRLMSRPPMVGGKPVFVGDDVTDEPAFAAARALEGHGILVGPARSTAADYGLPSPTALRHWLTKAAT